MSISWLSILLVVAALFVADTLFWVYQGKCMQKSGHLPWRRSFSGRILWKLLTPVIARLFVGEITVVGGEKPQRLRGRRIYVPNHTFQMDFNVAAMATQDHPFFLTLTSELRGVQGFVGALMGAIPVDTRQPGGGAAAVQACVTALCRGSNRALLIYPQGGLKPQYPLDRQEFQNGAIRIGQAVESQTGEPVFIVPMGTCYVRTSEKRAVNARSNFAAKMRRAFGVTNLGAAVVIGDPVPVSQLPADADKATDVLFEQIDNLTKQAMDVAESVRQQISRG